jgi:hypothetical protein
VSGRRAGKGKKLLPPEIVVSDKEVFHTPRLIVRRGIMEGEYIYK